MVAKSKTLRAVPYPKATGRFSRQEIRDAVIKVLAEMRAEVENRPEQRKRANGRTRG